MSARLYPFLLALVLTGPLAVAQDAASAAPALGLTAPRVSYGLNAGAMFAGRYGAASYLSPTVNYQLTNRLTLFGGLTYLRTTSPYYVPTEGAPRTSPYGTSRFLLQGGGTYALSPRLLLTGSAWKDLTPGLPGLPAVNPYAGFGGNLGQGVNLRADYRITEHFSVSGGVRVSQGGAYGPGFSPLLNSPAGF